MMHCYNFGVTLEAFPVKMSVNEYGVYYMIKIPFKNRSVSLCVIVEVVKN